MGKTANATSIEYHPRFGAIHLDDEIRAAIKKFPDVASCLKEGTVKDSELDLYAIDWDKIRNDGDAKVCLFMIFEQLGDPEQVKKWMVRHGFKPFGPRKGRGGSSVMKKFGYDPTDNVNRITAYWALEGQYPKFPTGGSMKYVRRVMSTGQNIGVAWFPDGRLSNVGISYNSIFN